MQNTLNLVRARARLAHKNDRGEKHGNSAVPATDLTMMTTIDCRQLDSLWPGLSSALFTDDKGQPSIGIDDRLTTPRFPALVGMRWDNVLTAVEVTFHNGSGLLADIVLSDCKVKIQGITPKNGGAVEMKIQIQAKPDGGEAGRLFELIDSHVDVSMRQVIDEPKQKSIDGVEPGEKGTEGGKKSRRRPDSKTAAAGEE